MQIIVDETEHANIISRKSVFWNFIPALVEKF